MEIITFKRHKYNWTNWLYSFTSWLTRMSLSAHLRLSPSFVLCSAEHRKTALVYKESFLSHRMLTHADGVLILVFREQILFVQMVLPAQTLLKRCRKEWDLFKNCVQGACSQYPMLLAPLLASRTFSIINKKVPYIASQWVSQKKQQHLYPCWTGVF